MDSYVQQKITEVAELVTTVDNGDIGSLLTYMFNQNIINQQDLYDIEADYSAVLDRANLDRANLFWWCED